jgi:hypothetical protein
MPESEVTKPTTSVEEVEEPKVDVVEQTSEELATQDISAVDVIPAGQKITLEDEVQEASTPTIAEDIPLEIKNYSEENIAKDANKGEQLGLF